jgi:hypothetical protein
MFSSVVSSSFFSAEQPCVSGRMVAKRLRSTHMNVGVHNDVNLQAPSPYKAFLSPKTRLGFVVFTCLSFKQIHKNVYFSHPRIRIYKYFMLFVTASAFLYLHADVSVVSEAVDQMYSLIQTQTKLVFVQ